MGSEWYRGIYITGTRKSIFLASNISSSISLSAPDTRRRCLYMCTISGRWSKPNLASTSHIFLHFNCHSPFLCHIHEDKGFFKTNPVDSTTIRIHTGTHYLFLLNFGTPCDALLLSRISLFVVFAIVCFSVATWLNKRFLGPGLVVIVELEHVSLDFCFLQY